MAGPPRDRDTKRETMTMTKTLCVILGCAALALTACTGKSADDDSADIQSCEGADCDDGGDESDGTGGESDGVCEDFLGCVEGCSDTACAESCAATHLGDGTLVSAQSLLDCVEAAGCPLDDEACILGACPDEAERFFDDCDSGGSDGAEECEVALDCAYACDPDEACALACGADLDSERKAAFEALVTCMADAGCGINEACMDASCEAEFRVWDELCT